MEDITNQTFDKMRIFATDTQSLNDTHQKCLHIFNGIKQNAATFKVLLHANVPHEYIIKTESFLEELVAYETSGDYYRTIAIFAALKEVAIAWFENGMKESPEKMADFFTGLFQI